MSYFEIIGGRRLEGKVAASGAKNSVLPILAAALLTQGETTLSRCPRITDVDAAVRILSHLGAKVKREGGVLTLDASGGISSEIPEALMREMRSSVIFLGAILSRTGEATVTSPGGCEIGLRPIDLHLDAMKRLGAEITQEGGKLLCKAKNGLKGARIYLSFPSVGATENAMIAAVRAEGETRICNAAAEPEISDLADFLNACGAKVSGAGSGEIRVEGVRRLHGASHTVIPDRIEAATYLLVPAVTGGDVTVTGVIPAHLSPVLDLLERMGAEVASQGESVRVRVSSRLKNAGTVRTLPYPGFPTDVQAPVAAAMGLGKGNAAIVETIFESRFRYAAELERFGAKIRVFDRTAFIEGVERYRPARATGPDLRGGAALVLAALAAPGQSTVDGIHHIDRGYEEMERRLSDLGARIQRKD